jgi:hypothetical protein
MIIKMKPGALPKYGHRSSLSLSEKDTNQLILKSLNKQEPSGMVEYLEYLSPKTNTTVLQIKNVSLNNVLLNQEVLVNYFGVEIELEGEHPTSDSL